MVMRANSLIEGKEAKTVLFCSRRIYGMRVPFVRRIATERALGDSDVLLL
jgi:hypothetical protein